MFPFDPEDHPTRTLGPTGRACAGRLAGSRLPTWESEEWRYSPVADLDFASFEPASSPAEVSSKRLARLRQDYPTQNLVVTQNGFPVLVEGLAEVGYDGARVEQTRDIFADINEVYGSPPVAVNVPAGETVANPVVIIHMVDGDHVAAMPRVVVNAAEASTVTVSELFVGSDGIALILPKIEIRCGAAAQVSYDGLQSVGERFWLLGSQISEIDAQATFKSSTAAFGGAYARLRTDCTLNGRGAHADLDAAYFGNGDQVLDFRTFQNHQAPDTTSRLVFKGAVDDSSRAIYTGMIRVAQQARGTSAFQTNANIKLGDEAWAESVPNLEIETDDVRCSHASTVGPIDDEHRFYLESRGVPQRVADKLILSGFFEEVLSSMSSPRLQELARSEVEAKLSNASLAQVA